MPGVQSCAAYLPYRRLARSEIAAVFGGRAGDGERTVASFDEDTTSMGVEAARACLRSAPDGTPGPGSLWFSTTEPTYLDKTNATAIHAALGLDSSCPAADANGAVRSAVGAIRAGLRGGGPTLAVSADIRAGLPTSADEADGGDAGAALLLGEGPGIAELVGEASVTEELTDRWRVPGEHRSRRWEDRFGDQAYGALVEQAWNAALKSAELSADGVDRVLVTGLHTRAVGRAARRLGAGGPSADLPARAGTPGAAAPALHLTAALEAASPGERIALVTVGDGADVLVFRVTDAVEALRPVRPVAGQLDAGAPVPYGRFLSWRGLVEVEPPNRPPPARTSSPAAARRRDWKFGFVAGRDPESGELALPPPPVDDVAPVPLADANGTVVALTVDHLVYSPSPPVVFAIVDFDGGGRAPLELTDADPSEVEVGDRVEMTFRRLSVADGIANYFWKARPARVAPARADP